MSQSESDSGDPEVHFFGCQSMMSGITDDLEVIKSSFMMLPVTFLLSEVMQFTLIQTGTDRCSQVLYIGKVPFSF